MREVNIGIVGLGYVGTGTLAILAENASQIALKLGFPLRVTAVCSRTVHAKEIPAGLGSVFRTNNWRELVEHPEVDIVAELVGGTHAARELLEAAIDRKKSVVTANKELMALCGADLWDRAIGAGVNLAMEASVAGGIPILGVLREGIAGDKLRLIGGEAKRLRAIAPSSPPPGSRATTSAVENCSSSACAGSTASASATRARPR